MLLAIDIGNTHIVIGLYEGEKLCDSWRVQSDSQRTVDEYALQLISILSTVGREATDVKKIILSCVVPPLTRVFTKVAVKYFSIEALVVGPGLKTGMSISVDDPRAVGADRIVNAVAAKKLVGAPAIIVDFGTATTFDVLSAAGEYVGGVIAPGVLISAEALFQRAAQLPSIEFTRPQGVIGKNTRESMLSGVYWGYISLVDGILSRLKDELGDSVPVIATGGLARSLADDSKYIERVEPELTLDGLQIIAAQND